MRHFHGVVALDTAARTITVRAGTRWREVQEALDKVALAVKIMQTYNSFTVGGALSVNAHGRYIGQGPLVRSVREVTLVLAGGSAVAEVIHVDPPRSFGYRLTAMRGLLAPLISHVDGRVDFVPVSAGTELTWQWTIHPRTAVAALPLAVFGRLWPSWAGKALDYIADQLAPAHD